MADISQIKTPNGTVYDIKDATARAALAGGMLAFIGKPSKLYSGDSGTTEVEPVNFGDNDTTVKRVKLGGAVNIRGTSYASGAVYTVQTGDTMIVGDSEYVAVVSTSGSSTTVKWNEFGSTSSLGELAFKNSGSVSIEYQGNPMLDVSLTGKEDTYAEVTDPVAGWSAEEAAGFTYTPSGTVSKPTLTKGTVTSTGNFTPAGGVTTATTENKTATVSSTTGTATYTPGGTVSQPTFTGNDVRLVTGNIAVPTSASVSGTVTQPTFSGSALTLTGTFTPEGSVATASTENKTATVSAAASGTTTYTPAGTVTQPTISVSTAGATTTIKNPTSKTVVTDMSVSAAASGTATGELVYFEVSGEVLTLKKLIETTGASITTENKTVKTGDAAYSATGAAFSGTAVRLVTGNIAVPKTYTFTGTEGNVSVSGTPAGTVSQPTFSGSVTLTNTNKSTTVTTETITTDKPKTYTPSGTVSQPSFTGTGARLVTGNIAVPKTYTFSGTQGGVSVTTTGAVTDVAAPTFTGVSKAFKTPVPTAGVAVIPPATLSADVNFS